MTFSYTDEQLNYLNRDEGVYSVNSKFVANHKGKWQKITANSKLKKNEKNKILVKGEQEFQVVATESASSGFDGLAVAPIVNGKPDYNSVAIIAAGTDSDAHFSDVRTAGEEVVTGLSPQYQDAEKFVKKVMDDKRYTVTQLSGYSQGSYMIKVGAKYHIPTTTFNTWFNYSCLTEKEKEYVKNHPKMFTDYRKPKDEIVRLNGRFETYIDYGFMDIPYPRLEWRSGNEPAERYDSTLPGFNSIYWVNYKTKSHNIKDWKFDSKTGRVVDSDGKTPVFVRGSSSYNATLSQMKHFKELKTKWSKSGLSTTEKLFLDAAQGQILTSNMAAAAQTAADEVSNLKSVADAEVDEVWSKIDFDSFTYLSSEEVRSIFAAQGVTYEKFVGGFQTETEQVATKMSEQATKFDTLRTQIDGAMDNILATDEKLAGEFREWTKKLQE